MTIKAELINPGPLTPRESEVAQLMAEGHSDKVIARVLAISIKTVNVHIGNIYLKLMDRSAALEDNAAGLNMRCRALAVMIARGMVSLSVRSVVLVLVFNAVLLDDEVLRARSGRVRGHVVSRIKRDA